MMHLTKTGLPCYYLANFPDFTPTLQMIEYTGEIVRPPISDIRERQIYNSLVVSFCL
jgi:hypothetical protein